MNSEAEKQQSPNNWKEVKLSRRFFHAFRGLYVLVKVIRHIIIYVVSAALIIIFGFYFHITSNEWMALVLSIGLVLISEAFNTAIEIDIDLTSPEYHPYARDTKDVAAGAVLLSAMTAVIVGLIIFIPKIFIK